MTRRDRDEYCYFTVLMWNCGVYYQRIGDLGEAEKAMSLSLQLLVYCSSSIQVVHASPKSPTSRTWRR